MNDYIKRVLSDNSLADEAALLGKATEPCIYVDRHVDLPKSHECADIVSAACVAGIRLLLIWKQKRGEMLKNGLCISMPVLIIDDEWLTGLADAPPPHVCITLAKSKASFDPPSFLDHGGNDVANSPLKELLVDAVGWERVVRVNSNPNPPYDASGFWLIL